MKKFGIIVFCLFIISCDKPHPASDIVYNEWIIFSDDTIFGALYEPPLKTLTLAFSSGEVHEYYDVSHQQFENLLQTNQPHQFFQQDIRPAHEVRVLTYDEATYQRVVREHQPVSSDRS